MPPVSRVVVTLMLLIAPTGLVTAVTASRLRRATLLLLWLVVSAAWFILAPPSSANTGMAGVSMSDTIEAMASALPTGRTT